MAVRGSVVQCSEVTDTAGTDSSHTGCQMPLVRWYQMTCGCSRQSCLPRGCAMSLRVVLGAHDDGALGGPRPAHR